MLKQPDNQKLARLQCSEGLLEDSRALAERLDCLLEPGGLEDESELWMEVRVFLAIDCEELGAEVARLSRQFELAPGRRTVSGT